jgi:hypothetical protein
MKKYSFLLSPLMLAAANSLACSFPASTLNQQTEKADEIFIATLIEAKLLPKDSRHEWPWIEGRFQVKKVLKGGAQPKDITLATGLGRGDCGVGMMVSWNYVIFKGRKETGIGVPNGTRLIEDFEEGELIEQIQSIMRQQKTKQKR